MNDQNDTPDDVIYTSISKHRREMLQDGRVDFAIRELTKMGFDVKLLGKATLEFEFGGHTVRFFPYTGWHAGKSIKDGRGWKNLRKQLVKGLPK